MIFRYAAFLSLFFLFACNNKKEEITTTYNDTKSLTQICALDTLTLKDRKLFIDSVLKLPATKNTIKEKYFKGYFHSLNDNVDSSAFYYKQINPQKNQKDWILLKKYCDLETTISYGEVIPFEKVKQIIYNLNVSKENKCIITYKYYDLLARAYFQNGNAKKAKEFSNLFVLSHPFKEAFNVQKKNEMNQFHLALREKDTFSMHKALKNLQKLSKKYKDDQLKWDLLKYNSQFLYSKGNNKEAFNLNIKHFNYLLENKKVSLLDFNNMGTMCLQINQPDLAISYYTKGIEWAQKNSKKANLYLFYQGLADAYEVKKNHKNAFENLKKAFEYNEANNAEIQSLKIEELNKKYNAEKKDLKIKDLADKNKLAKSENTQQRLIFSIIFLTLLLIFVFSYIIYKKNETEKKNSLLLSENKRLLLEQKVKQIQLNPHFIYNAIANLQGLIVNNEKIELANQYLVAFSKLMRDFLELNRNEFITLADEIEALQNYLKLQQMRFSNKFEYTISILVNNFETILIPPMLLQPFIENSIEHGFGNIDYKGSILITFSEENENLKIVIEDNGKNKAVHNNSTKKQSLSKTITQERFDILFGNKANFTVQKKESENGYIVNVKIPIVYE